MRLLVSMCSRTDEAPECLLLCDPDRRLVEPVALPDPKFGTFGLALTPSTVYAVVDLGRPLDEDTERSELRALDWATLRVRWRYPFELGRDVHSIAVNGGAMYAVSTGTDELLRLGLDPDGAVTSEEVAWRLDPEAERTDRQHLNDVALVGSQLLISGFGPRPGSNAWQDARDGYVRSVNNSSVALGPLYHPHSICSLGSGEFAVCESPRRRMLTSTGRTSGTLPGYARGLCATEGKVYVGTSRERHPSEPLSILPYDRPSTPTDGGIAAICQLDLATLSVQRVIELNPYGREVYDIAQLPP
jgi:hypothetical protein